MRIFRLHRKQRAASEFGGALIYPGRWNYAGTPMLYTSSSLSLSCLEVLVHLKPEEIPLDYVYSTMELAFTPEIADYHGDPHDEATTRLFGRWWSNDRSELAIRVPSAIIPIEFNVLLNPSHDDFSNLVWSTPEPFAFDDRLIRRVNPVA